MTFGGMTFGILVGFMVSGISTISITGFSTGMISGVIVSGTTGISVGGGGGSCGGLFVLTGIDLPPRWGFA